MLLRHYLERGTSKSALARKLGVHRDTIHRWIRAGELDRDLDNELVRYGRGGRSRPNWMRIRRSSTRGSRLIRSCRRCVCSKRFRPRATRVGSRS
jgi:transposase-like protein